jgi:hypothetical protein
MMLTSFARLRRHGALLVIVSLSMLHARFAIAGCLVPDLASLAAERARVSVSAPCHEIAPEASEICLAQCVQAASDFMGGADPGNPLPVAAFPTTRLFPLAWSGTASCAAQPKPTFATGPPLIYLLQRLLT